MDSAQQLIDEVLAMGFDSDVALSAGTCAAHARRYLHDHDDAARSELSLALRDIEHHVGLFGAAYTLALAVALATRRPAAEGTTYAITINGACDGCGVSVTNSFGEIDAYPEARLGDRHTLRCLCGGTVDGQVVAVTIDPWVAEPDQFDDADVIELDKHRSR